MLGYALFLFVLAYIVSLKRIVKRPMLYYQSNSVAESIAKSIPSFHKHFLPFFIYSKGYIESKVYQLRTKKHRDFQRMVLISKENEEILLDIYEIQEEPEKSVKQKKFGIFDKILTNFYFYDKILENKPVKKPKEKFTNSIKYDETFSTKNEILEKRPFSKIENILLVHGFNGSSSVSYINNLAFRLKGHRIFAVNARGSISELKSEKFFHIGYTDDLESVIEFILNNFEGNLVLIGFSMGASWVTNYLSKNVNDRISLGIGVCVPFDFYALNCKHQTSCVSLLMALEFKGYLRKHKTFKKYDYENLITVEEIDSVITTKVFNFQSVDEYYHTQSCKGKLSKIKTPMIFINTKDDPLIPYDTIPFDEIKENGLLILCLLETGGHLGMMDIFFNNSFLELSINDILKIFDKHK
ncbi:esterase [Tubulinosema ratisbonensis]|uniref:Esterase n=1 Tax=Tubulinosema ratisbonensis TaxID=291195 RepID=A0A437AMD9_9MICR|nr:esterase [Tubulinosema ratisbonensis]